MKVGGSEKLLAYVAGVAGNVSFQLKQEIQRCKTTLSISNTSHALALRRKLISLRIEIPDGERRKSSVTVATDGHC